MMRARRHGDRPVKHTRIVVSHYGGTEEIQVVEEECPEPKQGEVRVRVQAAAVSLPDGRSGPTSKIRGAVGRGV